jgi:hypothetical protein
MMAEFKNEFSWSKTRDDVFKICPRQYWFSFYGYSNGWIEKRCVLRLLDASRRAAEADRDRIIVIIELSNLQKELEKTEAK